MSTLRERVAAEKRAAAQQAQGGGAAAAAAPNGTATEPRSPEPAWVERLSSPERRQRQRSARGGRQPRLGSPPRGRRPAAAPRAAGEDVFQRLNSPSRESRRGASET